MSDKPKSAVAQGTNFVIYSGSYSPKAFQALSKPGKKQRQIFVAYPYRLYPKADYRRVYLELEKAFGVKFIFADEKITDLHILEKIQAYIRESEFGLYDITSWNPNVTLELGLALGMRERAFIVFDPSKTEIKEVPSDLRGMDRIQYSSYAELTENLGRLLAQEFPPPAKHEAENQLVILRAEALRLIKESGEIGMKVGEIAEKLGINVELAKVVVKPLVGNELHSKGVKKGMRYFHLGG